jgi:hypothetical protein
MDRQKNLQKVARMPQKGLVPICNPPASTGSAHSIPTVRFAGKDIRARSNGAVWLFGSRHLGIRIYLHKKLALLLSQKGKMASSRYITLEGGFTDPNVRILESSHNHSSCHSGSDALATVDAIEVDLAAHPLQA